MYDVIFLQYVWDNISASFHLHGMFLSADIPFEQYI